MDRDRLTWEHKTVINLQDPEKNILSKRKIDSSESSE